MSLDDAAKMIMEKSDVIGFGYVTKVDTPELEQQTFHMLLPLKGGANSDYPLAPIRVGRIGVVESGSKELPNKPEELAFVTLVRGERGFVVPACRRLLFDKGKMDLIRRLVGLHDAQSGPAAELMPNRPIPTPRR